MIVMIFVMIKIIATFYAALGSGVAFMAARKRGNASNERPDLLPSDGEKMRGGS